MWWIEKSTVRLNLTERMYLCWALIEQGTGHIKLLLDSIFVNKKKLCIALSDTVGEPNERIHIDLTFSGNENLLEADALVDYIHSQAKEDHCYTLIINELQRCKDFEKAINSLDRSKISDIYITGLKADTKKLFNRPTNGIKMNPFSIRDRIDHWENEWDLMYT